MAEVLDRSKAATLYERDFAAWARQQAELLRDARFDQLDLEHLIEEIETLGRKEKHEAESRAELILVHLLKLAFSPASEPRRGWIRTVLIQRQALARILTATLRTHLSEHFPQIFARARRMAAIELETDAIEPDVLPAESPFTADEVLDTEWLPQNTYDVDRGSS
jgi:hypothetical protein